MLRRRVPRLTAVEIDERLASALAERMSGSNVEVVHGDGTRLPFDPGQFSAATLFTMLHHVPSAARQDKLLAARLTAAGFAGPVVEVHDDRFRFLAAVPN